MGSIDAGCIWLTPNQNTTCWHVADMGKIIIVEFDKNKHMVQVNLHCKMMEKQVSEIVKGCVLHHSTDAWVLAWFRPWLQLMHCTNPLLSCLSISNKIWGPGTEGCVWGIRTQPHQVLV